MPCHYAVYECCGNCVFDFEGLIKKYFLKVTEALTQKRVVVVAMLKKCRVPTPALAAIKTADHVHTQPQIYYVNASYIQ